MEAIRTELRDGRIHRLVAILAAAEEDQSCGKLVSIRLREKSSTHHHESKSGNSHFPDART